MGVDRAHAQPPGRAVGVGDGDGAADPPMVTAGRRLGYGESGGVVRVHRARGDAEVDDLAEGCGIGRGDLLADPVEYDVSAAEPRGELHAWGPGDARGEVRAQASSARGAAVAAAVDDQVGSQRLIDALGRGYLEGGADDREERHDG